MYSISDYGAMMADPVRMDAHVRALRQAVTPETVVLDIGTGTGIFALLAAKFGARRVFAIEPNDAIQVAHELARANGLAERIEFFQDLSTRVALPERADVAISDLRGILPPLGNHIGAIVDARQRLLKPGARLIPMKDTLWAAVVDAPQQYAELAGPWQNGKFGLDMSSVLPLVTSTWSSAKLESRQLLCQPQRWAEIDYATIASPDIGGDFNASIERAGTGHGLAVWFDAQVAEGIGFSNAAGRDAAIYGTAFFPWPTPVALAAGDSARVAIHARFVQDDYVWNWETSLHDSRGAGRREFRQSTFHAVPLSLQALRRQAGTSAPALSEEGQVDQFILARMDGRTRLADIAAELQRVFPQSFKGPGEAMARVARVAGKYAL